MLYRVAKDIESHGFGCPTKKYMDKIKVELTEAINEVVTLTPEEREIIDQAFNTQLIPKGALWVEQGKRCLQVGFILSGKFRFYYTDESGNEITCYFTGPGEFLTSFTSFLTNAPAKENIQALEDTLLRVITKDALEELSDRVSKMHVFRRINAENLFLVIEKRVIMLQSQSAYERYEKMLKENPEILLSVPLHYTASFLGITPQHLSRIRKELAK